MPEKKKIVNNNNCDNTNSTTKTEPIPIKKMNMLYHDHLVQNKLLCCVSFQLTDAFVKLVDGAIFVLVIMTIFFK